MKTSHPFHALAAVTALALLIPAVPASAALFYHATVDTSSLIGDPLAPFSLYFQFNDGEGTGDANNTILLSNFTYGGGSATGMATATGGASGDLTLGISITDSSAFNDIYQGFTPGSSLGFDITLTTAVDAGPFPDKFGFANLDSSLSNILTAGPGDQFITIDVDSPTSPTVLTFGSSQSPFTILPPTVTELAAVPEPATALFGLACVGVAAVRRRRSAYDAHRAKGKE